jgi:transcriptional regulator with XRE-family HTH domain
MFDFNRFEELRKEKGVTKKFIAQQLGRTETIVQDWKKGKSSPNESQLSVVALILGTTPAYLTGESNEKAPAVIGEGSERDKEIMKLLSEISDETKASLIPLLEQLKDREKR